MVFGERFFVESARFRETCLEMCALIGCTGDVTAEQVDACADRCVDKQRAAEQVGAQCTDAYPRSVQCFAALECSEYLAWEGGDASVCQAPLSAFEQSCPDLTFDFRE